MAFLDRITALNRALPNRDYYRFIVNNISVGYVDTQFLPALDDTLFSISKNTRSVSCNFSNSEKHDFEIVVDNFFRRYFQENKLNGWRDERYAVSASFTSEPLFLIERAALSFLGISGRGSHVNGYVKKCDGLYLWVGKRSLSKPTSPGKLDQIAAGGIPYGVSVIENVVKECQEEANIPEDIARQATPVSIICSAYDLPIGLRPDVMFNYDLELPQDFVPQANDGEVSEFKLMHINDVLTIIDKTEDFKFNSAVVIIDFAIRHGFINADHPDYIELCQGMFASQMRLSSL